LLGLPPPYEALWGHPGFVVPEVRHSGRQWFSFPFAMCQNLFEQLLQASLPLILSFRVMTTTTGSRLEAGPGTPLTTVKEAWDGPLNQAYRSAAEWGPIFEVPSHPLAPERAERDSGRILVWLQDLRTKDIKDLFPWEKDREIPNGTEDQIIRQGSFFNLLTLFYKLNNYLWSVLYCCCIQRRTIIIGQIMMQKGDCLFARNSYGSGNPCDDILLAWVFDWCVGDRLI
jgi:hypothetical protein